MPFLLNVFLHLALAVECDGCAEKVIAQHLADTVLAAQDLASAEAAPAPQPATLPDEPTTGRRGSALAAG